ncbi:MAG: hypothetical protein CMB53_05030 [Euryarchaeota archaeon]|nr:hypothetical protein [Euryarchaeota archaeon]MBK70737.1 hypothetical protein [Euryarchaeota archaeon]|tara:strand:+ start:21433 stop:22737 length:1305 start_codon:yes stop_codon:yes gene_type:complete
MSEESVHASVRPSPDVVKEGGRRASSKSSRKGDPSFLMTEEMRRLSTPWGVALARAGQIDPKSLGPGVIADAAAGSGIQLIAYSKILKRPSLGVEIDGNIAVLCAANMFVAAEPDDVQRSMDRVVIGDGSDAEGVMVEYWSSLREAGTRAHPPVAMLHLDPARPTDAQNHHIDEMEPPLGPLLSSWKNYLEPGTDGPSILLDLSPRLDEDQRSMIDAIIETSFPGIRRTWEWLSQGGGRVDRLSVWSGSLSSKSPRRCVRMGRKKIMASIEGKPTIADSADLSEPPPFGSWMTILDPVLLESGLQDHWIEEALGDRGGRTWLRTSGRRPILIHTEPIEGDDDVMGFVVATGQVVQHRLSPPELHSIDLTAAALARNDIGSITLRCSLDPELHPTLQRRLHKAMRDIEGSRSFMADVQLVRGDSGHTVYVICKEP